MSNLRIGFANKYFTLWSVWTEPVYSTNAAGQHSQTGTRTHFDYLRNLAIDEDVAICKAREAGVTNLTVDETLRGKRHSFSEVKHDRPKYPANQFDFGKYEGQLITQATDLKYLKWYVDTSISPETKQCVIDRILELDPDMTYTEGRLIHRDTLIINQVRKQIEAGELEMRALSNFQRVDSQLWSVKAEIANPVTEAQHVYNEQLVQDWHLQKMYFTTQGLPFELQERFFRGNEYYTPTGSRSFKGTIFTCTRVLPTLEAAFQMKLV